MGSRDNVTADRAVFSAFVSYSHADEAIAKKLHRKIETYSLPKRLGDSDDISQFNKGKIGPVFRDREDLPAGIDLSSSVKSALQNSHTLIILCSPHAKKSPWVNKEITLFRQLHPDRPILAALISGEPEDAFPDALIADGREPLAADLRKNGDGWKLGFLKLIAGITNVPLDSLIQRDAQRKLRRVIAVTLVTVVALLAMIGMTIFAFKQRQEAQEQRVAAEKLVTFMLNDLRNELKGVSTLRVMQKVNLETWEYYKQQGDLSDIPDDSLGQRATILHAWGEDDEKEAKLDQALEKFKEAHRVTEELLGRDPDNPKRIFEHAQSEYWVGFAAWQNDKKDITARFWKNYLNQAQKLFEVEPNRIRSFMELGYSNGNMCELSMAHERDIETALSYCSQAVHYVESAVKLDPDNIENIISLANRHGWMADILLYNKQFDEAINNRDIEQNLVDNLLKDDPENRRLQFHSTWPKIGIAEIENDRDESEKAMAALENVPELLLNLSQAMPDNQHVIAVQIRVEMLLANIKYKSAIEGWKKHQDNAQSLFRKAKEGREGEPVRRMKKLLKLGGY